MHWVLCSMRGSALWSGSWCERIYAVSFNERIRHVHFLLLPRTADMPRGHVISDLYRRVRNLLRRVGVLRNPTAAERADIAGRIRAEWLPWELVLPSPASDRGRGVRCAHLMARVGALDHTGPKLRGFAGHHPGSHPRGVLAQDETDWRGF